MGTILRYKLRESSDQDILLIDSNGDAVTNNAGQAVTLNNPGETITVTDSNGTDLGITL